MNYLGLTPRSTRRGRGVIKAASPRRETAKARRALVEGAWAYRYPAKVSRHLQLRLEKLPAEVQAISWKAQVRLCRRYRQLSARGKHVNQVVVAIPREMAAFGGDRALRAAGLLTPPRTSTTRWRAHRRRSRPRVIGGGAAPVSAQSSIALRGYDPRP